MLKYLLSFILLLSLGNSYAQNRSSIKGKILDSLDKQPIEMVTVSVTLVKDSSYVAYSSSLKNGDFSIKNIPSDKAIAITAYVAGYETYVKVLSLKKDQILDLGDIYLSIKYNLLNQVVVSAAMQAIVIDKDTIAYNVAAFKVRPNAVVEELLRKLPGVQIDSEGITVNGKRVAKVLVDGKEFFGSDHKIALQNLDADLLDKIQVYDDREDDPDHLIEDDKVNKIINLKFKKKFKKSIFGKVYAGSGSNERFESGALFNMFRDTLQISIIGVGNNLNKTGFSRHDLSDLGGFNRSEGNTYELSLGGQGYNGIEKVLSGGININNDYGKKLKMNLLYFYGNSRNISDYSTVVSNYLNTDTIISHSNYSNNWNNRNHNISGLIQWKPDTIHTLRYAPKVRLGSGNSTYSGINDSYNTLNPISKNESSANRNNNSNSFSHTLSYHRNLKKKGQSLNINHNLNINPSKNDSYNSNDLTPFSSGLNPEMIRRLNTNNYNYSNAFLSASYRHPITKKLTVHTTISGDYSINARETNFFDQDLNSLAYSIFLEDQSSDLDRYQWSEKVKAGFQYQINKKINLDMGLTHEWLQIKNKFHKNIADMQINQTYFLPDFRISFYNSSINYSVNVRQPDIYNLQPVTIQQSQLYSFTGNPYLKPTKTHNFGLNSNQYIKKSDLSINFYANLRLEENSTTTIQTLNGDGISTSSPINKDGAYGAYGGLSFNKKFKKFNDIIISYRPNLNYNFNHRFIVLNQNQGFQDNHYIYLSQGFNFNWKDRIDLEPNYTFNKVYTTYDIPGFNKLDYDTHNFRMNYSVKWIKKLFIEGNYTYSYNPTQGADFQKTANILNASLAYQMLKKDRGELKLSCYDLFNQNIDRYVGVGSNSVYNYQFTNLRRYFLVSYIIKFNKTITD
jgi:hypothetical protein